MGRKAINTVSSIHGIHWEALYDPIFKWPPIKVVPFLKVCDWVNKLGLFQEGIAKSPISRALASFTHLTSLSSIDDEALFWSIQGLEAFYCRGIGDLRHQLSGKSRLFLGNWDEMKNLVGNLYDFRSKFVHGVFNLVRWNNDNDEAVMEDTDQDKLYNATMLASRMLLSTLQKCAEKGITSIDFGYSMKVKHG